MSQSGRIAHSRALPNYQNAVLPRVKLEKYVLDLTNPVSKHKAILFKRVLGFVQSDWGLLAKAILDELPYYEAVLGRRNHYGQRYNVTMPIIGPNGRTADVLTAWIIDTGEDYPRFITAYVE
jgi:hypothetical protein